MKTITLTAYHFWDLEEEVRNKVIGDHIEFWIETREYNEKFPGNFEKAIDEAEKMQTPWFTGNYIYEYCKKEIIEEIEQYNFLFTKTGEVLALI